MSWVTLEPEWRGWMVHVAPGAGFASPRAHTTPPLLMDAMDGTVGERRARRYT